jgi:undecaprenyl-diphosphatase
MAFISGIGAIAGLLRYLRTHSTIVFVADRIVLGALLFGLLAAGVLAPYSQEGESQSSSVQAGR